MHHSVVSPSTRDFCTACAVKSSRCNLLPGGTCGTNSNRMRAPAQENYVCLSQSLSFSLSHTHTHAHTLTLTHSLSPSLPLLLPLPLCPSLISFLHNNSTATWPSSGTSSLEKGTSRVITPPPPPQTAQAPQTAVPTHSQMFALVSRKLYCAVVIFCFRQRPAVALSIWCTQLVCISLGRA